MWYGKKLISQDPSWIINDPYFISASHVLDQGKRCIGPGEEVYWTRGRGVLDQGEGRVNNSHTLREIRSMTCNTLENCWFA